MKLILTFVFLSTSFVLRGDEISLSYISVVELFADEAVVFKTCTSSKL